MSRAGNWGERENDRGGGEEKYPGPRGFLNNPPRGEIRTATSSPRGASAPSGENLWDQGRGEREGKERAVFLPLPFRRRFYSRPSFAPARRSAAESPNRIPLNLGPHFPLNEGWEKCDHARHLIPRSYTDIIGVVNGKIMQQLS